MLSTVEIARIDQVTWGHVSLESVCKLFLKKIGKGGESPVMTWDTCASIRAKLPSGEETQKFGDSHSRFWALGTGSRQATMLQWKPTFVPLPPPPPPASSRHSHSSLASCCLSSSSSRHSHGSLASYCLSSSSSSSSHHSHGSLASCCCCCLSLSTIAPKSGGGSLAAVAASSRLLRYVGASQWVPCFRVLQLLPSRFTQRNLCCMSRATTQHHQNSERKSDLPLISLWLLEVRVSWFREWNISSSQLCPLLSVLYLIKSEAVLVQSL